MAAINPDQHRMSLGDHLEELRSRLFIGLVGPVVAAIIMLVFGRQIVTFLAQPALAAMAQYDLEQRMVNPTFTSAFAVYMRVSLIGGLIVGIPWLFWQLWRFVAPGLYHTEQRIVKLLVPASAGLTLVGVTFLYYVLLPLMLQFLLFFAVSFEPPRVDAPPPENNGAQNVEELPNLLRLPQLAYDPPNAEVGDAWLNMSARELRVVVEEGVIWRARLMPSLMMEPLIQLDQYISFVMTMALIFAIAFQLPLVMLVLGKVGIISYHQLAHVRKYALLVIAVLSAMATPGDPFSMVGLMVPLYGLYELGLLLIKWFGPPPELAWGGPDEDEASEPAWDGPEEDEGRERS